MTAPILVFGWGNPSRGDDALGPLFVERIEALDIPGIECLTDFQLQVEHALDLEGRQYVLFVDASLDNEAPFSVRQLTPAAGVTFGSHSLAPEAVMQVFAEFQDRDPPSCTLLGIRGEEYGLGKPLSPLATENLERACAWARDWLMKVSAEMKDGVREGTPSFGDRLGG